MMIKMASKAKGDFKSDWELLSTSDIQSNFAAEYNSSRGYAFLTEPDSNLKCSICLEIATEPRQEEGCGKLFCASCIALHGESKPCPNCRATPKYFTDKKSLRDIKDLKVKCKYFESGCTWEGNLSDVENHQSKMCEFKIVPCKFQSIGCNYMNSRKKLKHHEEKEDKIHLQLAMLAILKLTERSQILLSGKSKVVKMPGFLRHKTNQMPFHSFPFHTSHHGYKFELKVDAYGSGQGHGTHLSVYINILESRHSHELSWPFQGEIMVELLNQLADQGHIQQAIAFEVINDVHPGIGRGFSQFIDHTRLHHNHESNTQYIMDDSLFFRVTVKLKNDRPWLNA